MRLVLIHLCRVILYSEDGSPIFSLFCLCTCRSSCMVFRLYEMTFVEIILMDLFGAEILSNLKCKCTVWSKGIALP